MGANLLAKIIREQARSHETFTGLRCYLKSAYGTNGCTGNGKFPCQTSKV